MKTYEGVAMSWILGWFVLWWPYFYATDQGTLIGGLINGILGLGTAVMILWIGRKWEECNGKA